MAVLVFVRRDSLLGEAEAPVNVVAQYSIDQAMPIDAMGAEYTRLTVQDVYVTMNREGGGMPQPKLRSDWRDDYKTVLNAEASRRILAAFPTYKQQNYQQAVVEYTNTYGADPSTWPAEAQAVKAEGDRGWRYIKDVRDASNAWTAMPTDPTADEIWPTVITPVD
jgi:hypothetical protein